MCSHSQQPVVLWAPIMKCIALILQHQIMASHLPHRVTEKLMWEETSGGHLSNTPQLKAVPIKVGCSGLCS